jgi:hypothetical protein
MMLLQKMFGHDCGAAVFEVDSEKIGGRVKTAELAINAHVFSEPAHLQF